MIAGVCAGIGEYANIDPKSYDCGRPIILPYGPGMIVAYIIMALIIPEGASRQAS
jgi:phage shock protein PspC (stress-responsive transcriptional regulator)